MEDTATINISMPRSLAKYAKELALKSKTSESEIIVKCLEEKRLNDLLVEGYQAMGPENEKLAEAFLVCEGNEWPVWEKK